MMFFNDAVYNAANLNSKINILRQYFIEAALFFTVRGIYVHSNNALIIEQSLPVIGTMNLSGAIPGQFLLLVNSLLDADLFFLRATMDVINNIEADEQEAAGINATPPAA
jgi:hypothetical protein